MPLDDRGIRRSAQPGNIDNLQRCRRHQITHQGISKRAANHPDDENRHAEESTYGTPAGSGSFWNFDLQPRQRDDRDQLDNRNGEEATRIEDIGNKIHRAPGDFRPEERRRQTAGKNIGNRLWPPIRGNAVRGGIAIIAGNPHRHAKPHAGTAEHQEIRGDHGDAKAGC